MAHAAAGACCRVVAVEPIVAAEAVGAIMAVDPGVSEAGRSADDRGRRPC
jgi:hypothetical protein